MATIDDVYNYLTSPTQGLPEIIAQLTDIQARLGEMPGDAPLADVLQGWFGYAPGSGNIADQVTQTRLLCGYFFDWWNPSDPPSLGGKITTILAVCYDITGSYLSNPPEFEHDANAIQMILNSVRRTFIVPD